MFCSWYRATWPYWLLNLGEPGWSTQPGSAVSPRCRPYGWLAVLLQLVVIEFGCGRHRGLSLRSNFARLPSIWLAGGVPAVEWVMRLALRRISRRALWLPQRGRDHSKLSNDPWNPNLRCVYPYVCLAIWTWMGRSVPFPGSAAR